MEDRYKEFIAALYGAEESAVVQVPVVYRDGRQGVVTAEIKVNRID